LTAGQTGYAILGGGVSEIIDAIELQLRKYQHADYKYFDEPIRDQLAKLLLEDNFYGLDRVLFSGGSGSEACEMALQFSYQIHCEMGRQGKAWAIATRQSYHGSTIGALSVGERPNLEFFSPLLPQNRLRIPECNFIKHRMVGETTEDYGIRAANYLEAAIISVGPERVGCFVAETMLGGLVGDVPAVPSYWPRVREICTKYDVHLILDEVWCGGGVTGKLHCFDWESNCSPDFVFTGKSIAAGYFPLSLVLTHSRFEEIVKYGSGRLELSCTFQGHSAACAAAVATQQIIRSQDLLQRTEDLGDLVRGILLSELKDHEFFVDVRGRGIRNTLEYNCNSRHLFGQRISDILRQKHKIFISGKWHRISLTHSMLISQAILEDALAVLVETFRFVSSCWTDDYIATISEREFF